MPHPRNRSRGFRPSWRCFRTWWPGRSSATRRWPNNCASANTPLSRFASGVAIFIVGFAKKILLANPCGQVADAVFDAANPVRARRLGRRVGLRVPDLFRFLRLFGYGRRAGANARVRIPAEFRRALSLGEHHGTLAALAHLPLERVAGLFVLLRLAATGKARGALISISPW